VIIIELPKIPKTADGAIWPWLRFFKCRKKEEFEMLKKKHPELKEAVSCAYKITFRERWRHTLLDWQMRRMDERQFKRQWREEGLEEGRAEGRTEGRTEGKAEGQKEGHKKATQEIARNLLTEGSTPEFVQKITGLDLETIQKLNG
jgi:predicted transposase/invertase (TIGR01784 family)